MKNTEFDDNDKKTFIKAMREYRLTGNSRTKCNNCGAIIKFKKIKNVVNHNCKCGKFNGTLREL